MERRPYLGSTSDLFLVTPGMVVKTPRPNSSKNQAALLIEQQLLERLGKHPRIVPYLGLHPSGILLAEAPYGSLKGVIHSDLRPENFVVHQAPQPFAGIWLCDFGGSFCAELDLDGEHLPDIPFSDPQMGTESTPATDIFSLGSIFYAILTGYWPFLDRPPNWTSTEDYWAYYDRAVELLEQRKFPDVSGLDGGDVIKGCWDLK
ncbi:hypothetical protein L204_106368 [Cryptococcus depauperatus]|nr:hypothetical protein L204_06240 [Cryptococcus depauperatus CBS 7855]